MSDSGQKGLSPFPRGTKEQSLTRGVSCRDRDSERTRTTSGGYQEVTEVYFKGRVGVEIREGYKWCGRSVT